jgi:hypothetical protein
MRKPMVPEIGPTVIEVRPQFDGIVRKSPGL